MTGPFQNYYVYQHQDVKTGEIVYIGHGSKGRAWTCGHKGLPIRSEEHVDWIEKLLSDGWTPADFVFIIEQGLTKDAAKEIELDLITGVRPKFNKNFSRQGKMTNKILEECISLRESGLSFFDIGQKIGLSTMTVHRAIMGKVKSLENFVAPV